MSLPSSKGGYSYICEYSFLCATGAVINTAIVMATEKGMNVSTAGSTCKLKECMPFENISQQCVIFFKVFGKYFRKFSHLKITTYIVCT